MERKYISNAVTKFVLRKRILIPFFLVAAYILLTIAWRQWNNIPVPHYIPQDSQWKLIIKESNRASWGLPCVYARFEVDQPQSSVATKIKKIISGLRKWDSSGEENYSSIIDEIREDPDFPVKDKTFRQEMRERKLLPRGGIVGKDHILRTEKPFLVLSWFGREEGERKHSISVRLIGADDNQTTVEIWDIRWPDI